MGIPRFGEFRDPPPEGQVFRPQPERSMYIILWRFRPNSGWESEFEHAYGPSGPWVKLFSRADGYLGSELLSGVEPDQEYLCVDHWTSREAWTAFQTRWAGEYRALDRRLESLTATETSLGAYVAVFAGP